MAQKEFMLQIEIPVVKWKKEVYSFESKHERDLAIKRVKSISTAPANAKWKKL